MPSSLPPELEAACKDGSIDQVRQLLASPTLFATLSKVPTLFEIACIAARTDRPELLTLCFEQGLRVENGTENSPLLHAADSGQSVEVFRVLLCHGWDLNTNWSEYDGDSLTSACCQGNAPLVQFLLQNGADPNSDRPCGGDSIAIIWAVSGSRASVRVLEQLLDGGCTIRKTGALIAAAEAGNMDAAKVLVERGADLEEVWDYGGYVDRARELRQGTALFKACEAGQAEIVEYLLSKGSNAAFRDGIDRSPFSVAKDNGHEKVLEILRGRGIHE
ncbi:hypothetical protein MMC10_000678 [Thelotrema lepadinum]|nr:hypothetical protein [Thelotrema lepadinum]